MVDLLTHLLFTGVETEQLTGEWQAKVHMTQLQSKLLGQHLAPSSLQHPIATRGAKPSFLQKALYSWSVIFGA